MNNFIKKEDVGKFVKLVLSPEEYDLLIDLLSFEFTIQITGIIKTDKISSDDKAIKAITLFHSYRGLDDQLKDFESFFMENDKKATLYLPKNIVNFYKMLCTETISLPSLPLFISKKYDKYGQDLLKKIFKSLEEDLSIGDLERAMSDELDSPIIQDSLDIKEFGDINLNIFKKGSA